jgi:hypothetical protein
MQIAGRLVTDITKTLQLTHDFIIGGSRADLGLFHQGCAVNGHRILPDMV